MPNARDFNIFGKPRRFIVYGRPGTTKTRSLRTAPGPVYVIDVDDGMSVNIGVDMEYDAFNPSDYKSYSAVRNKLIELSKMVKARPDLGPNKVEFPYATVVIDSFTTLSQVTMEDIYVTNGQRWSKDRRQDYGVLFERLKEMMNMLYRLPCHTILIAHEYWDKSENGTPLKCNMLISGQKFSEIVPVFASDLFHAEADTVGGKTTFRFRTTPSGTIDAKTRLPGLSEFEPMDYMAMMKKAEDFVKKGGDK